MAIRRVDETIFLDGVCAVEDAELLVQQFDGATAIDWGGCTHLHAACLQMMLASGLPIGGTPVNPELARWLVPVVHRPAPVGATINPILRETVSELES